MKKNLLYIGNKLSHSGKTITTLETLSKLLETLNYNVVSVSNKKNKVFRLLDMLRSIIKHRKSVNYVLIDTYSTKNFYYALLCSIVCKFLSLKYIPILHGGNLPNRLKKNKKLSDIIFKNAYVNIAPSEYTKSNFEAEGYSNILCIPNTIEIDNYKFKTRSFNSIRLLWVRSFSKIYNPELAVQVAHKLKSLGEDVSLCMIGPDNDGSLVEVKKLANSLHINVEFTGKLTKQEWVKKSEDYNIFINTTNFDNMPVSVIEAMALGLPIVSTNVGGIPYLITNKENGLLVNKGDREEMIEAILNIKEDVELVIKLTRNARERVKQFNWSTVKLLWLDLLK